VFEQLIESQARTRYTSTVQTTLASMVFHAVAITGAILATLHAGEVVEQIRQVDLTVAIQEKPKEPPPPEQDVAVVAPQPKGFQTLAMPVSIPVDIPPPDVNTRFDAADFTGIGVEGGVGRGVVGGTGPITNQPYLEAVVEERPERISTPPVRYPEILRQAGVDGQVLVQMTVDTTGRVERGSVHIVSSSHQLFESSAREAAAVTRFRPGRIQGRAVRVIVRMPINFVITRGGLGN
jgi:protein TonB